MKPLRAIWSGVGPDEMHGLIHITTDGRRYSSSKAVLHERELANPRLIFKVRHRVRK